MDDKSASIEEVEAVVKKWAYLQKFLDSSSVGGGGGGGDYKMTKRKTTEPSKNVADISILMMGMW